MHILVRFDASTELPIGSLFSFARRQVLLAHVRRIPTPQVQGIRDILYYSSGGNSVHCGDNDVGAPLAVPMYLISLLNFIYRYRIL